MIKDRVQNIFYHIVNAILGVVMLGISLNCMYRAYKCLDDELFSVIWIVIGITGMVFCWQIFFSNCSSKETKEIVLPYRYSKSFKEHLIFIILPSIMCVMFIVGCVVSWGNHRFLSGSILLVFSLLLTFFLVYNLFRCNDFLKLSELGIEGKIHSRVLDFHPRYFNINWNGIASIKIATFRKGKFDVIIKSNQQNEWTITSDNIGFCIYELQIDITRHYPFVELESDYLKKSRYDLTDYFHVLPNSSSSYKDLSNRKKFVFDDKYTGLIYAIDDISFIKTKFAIEAIDNAISQLSKHSDTSSKKCMDFLERRKAFFLIESKQFDLAKRCLSKLSENPANSSFVYNEIEYLNQVK